MASREPRPQLTPSPPLDGPAPDPPPAPPLACPWDSIYHRLFAHGVMLADLLSNYLSADLVAELDLGRFAREAPVPLSGTLHSDKAHTRAADLLQPLFTTMALPWCGALLVLEFQATPDTTMSVRMMVYGGLGLQQLLDLARDRPEAFEASALAALWPTPTNLPPVLPVVLYHGARRWGGHRSVAQSIRVAGGTALQRLQPDGHYALIDAHRDAPRTKHRGPCVLLFEMLRSEDTAGLRCASEELDVLLAAHEPSVPLDVDGDPEDVLARNASLRGAFVLFILGLLRSRCYAIPHEFIVTAVRPRLPSDAGSPASCCSPGSLLCWTDAGSGWASVSRESSP